MSFNEYVRARKLFTYHDEGMSPWPRDQQKLFAEYQRKKIIALEEKFPEFSKAYEYYEKEKYRP
jgi:hypothetical protein